jgi:hypothetical protein
MYMNTIPYIYYNQQCMVYCVAAVQAGGALVTSAPLQLCCKAADTSTQRLVTTDRLLETHHGPLLQALKQVSAMSGEGCAALVLVKRRTRGPEGLRARGRAHTSCTVVRVLRGWCAQHEAGGVASVLEWVLFTTHPHLLLGPLQLSLHMPVPHSRPPLHPPPHRPCVPPGGPPGGHGAARQ